MFCRSPSPCPGPSNRSSRTLSAMAFTGIILNADSDHSHWLIPLSGLARSFFVGSSMWRSLGIIEMRHSEQQLFLHLVAEVTAQETRVLSLTRLPRSPEAPPRSQRTKARGMTRLEKSTRTSSHCRAGQPFALPIQKWKAGECDATGRNCQCLVLCLSLLAACSYPSHKHRLAPSYLHITSAWQDRKGK